jgi:toxin ParE1/3/4
MRTFRLSAFAKDDLARIYRRGLLEFGERQAENYLDQLLNYFDEISARPLAYPAVDDIRKGYRRCVVGRQDIADWI